MRILVTGADGFVGQRLVPRLVREGHAVTGGVRPGQPFFASGPPAPWGGSVDVVPLELLDGVSVRLALSLGFDAVVHLAAVASGGDARRDPGEAWAINAVGTARLAEELARQGRGGPGAATLLLASTGEVYGAELTRPRVETDAASPCSPYAASKLGAEQAALEVHRRTGLRVVVARAFPHTGKGQDERFVVPAFARRLVEARRSGARAVRVGNLEPVRQFLHVSDVVAAYVALLEEGKPGEVYNVAGGEPLTLKELFERLAAILGYPAVPEPDPELQRSADIPHLVGDASRLRQLTGWEPRVSLEATLTEVVHAQAH